MSEYTVYITCCDVCKKEATASYSCLIDMGWTKFSFKYQYKNGASISEIDTEITVCKKCNGPKGYRRMILFIKGFIK